MTKKEKQERVSKLITSTENAFKKLGFRHISYEYSMKNDDIKVVNYSKTGLLDGEDSDESVKFYSKRKKFYYKCSVEETLELKQLINKQLYLLNYTIKNDLDYVDYEDYLDIYE